MSRDFAVLYIFKPNLCFSFATFGGYFEFSTKSELLYFNFVSLLVISFLVSMRVLSLMSNSSLSVLNFVNGD